MTFVDTNVFMYAVGSTHPLRQPARDFFRDAVHNQQRLCTSAEVLQELLHAYLPVGRLQTLDVALELVQTSAHEIWPVEVDDVLLARDAVSRFPGLGARDVLHLACCRRHGVNKFKTFDRALAAAFA